MAFMVCSKPYAFWNPFIRHVQVFPPYHHTACNWSQIEYFCFTACA